MVHSMDATRMSAPVVLLVGAVCLLAPLCFWLMVRHRELLQVIKICRVQMALLQVSTAQPADPAPAGAHRRNPRNGHAKNIECDESFHQALRVSLGLVDGQELHCSARSISPRGCPSLASEQRQRSAAEDSQTDAAIRLRHISSSRDLSTAWENPGPDGLFGTGRRRAGAAPSAVARAPQSQAQHSFTRTKSAPATPPTDMKGRRKSLSSGTADSIY